MGLAVVGEDAASGSHGDLTRILRYGQSAEVLNNRIVALLRCAVPGQLVGVRGAALDGLAAGGYEGRGLAVHKTGDAAFRGQRSAVIGLAVAGSGHSQGRGSDSHFTIGDIGNDNLIVLGDIIDVEAVGGQAHIIGTDMDLGSLRGNAALQGDGNTIGEGSIYRKAFRGVGRSLVHAAASCTGDGHIDDRLLFKVGGVGVGFIDAIGILAGDEAGIGADLFSLAVRPVDEVIVIISRRGGALGSAGCRLHRLGCTAYGTAFSRNVVDGYVIVFRVSNGNGLVRRGHRAGDSFPAGGVAGDHGGGHTIGCIIGDLVVYIRFRGSGAVLVNIVDGEREVTLLPLRLEGYIVARHGEGGAALVGFFRAIGGQIGSCPAHKLIASLGGLFGKNADKGALILRIAGGSLVPGAASQVVGHRITRHILGVEIHIAVSNGIGEGHLAGTVFIGIPAVKGIGNAIRRLRFGKVTDSIEVTRLGGIILVVVLSRFPLIAVGASIPQIVGSGIDILCLNFNGAVHMVLFVIGNFVGMQDDRCYIVLRYRHTKSLGYAIFIGIKNGLPVAAACGNHASHIATRPGDNTASRIEAVFIVHPGSACNVDRAFSQRFPPLIHAIGSRIAGGCLQVVELCRVCSCSRVLDGNRMGGSFDRAVPICDRDGNGSFTGLDAVNLTGLVHGEDFLVAALPDRGKNGRVIGVQGGGQLGIGERLHCGRSGDADFGQIGSGNGDGLGSGDTHAVRYLNRRGSGFQSRNDAGR